MYGYIYKFTNLSNGKIYVGKHKFSEEHLDESYYGSGTIWENVLEKYGVENIKREVLGYYPTLESLNAGEQYWIDKLDARNYLIGYNIAPGGDGGDINSSLSPEAYQEYISKLSESTSNKRWYNNGLVNIYPTLGEEIPEGFKPGRCNIAKPTMTPEQKEVWKQHISEKTTKAMNTPEMKAYMKIANKKTDEWKKHLSEANKGHITSEETKQKLSIIGKNNKYKWLLPDGTIRIMDPGNGAKHKDWIKLEKVSADYTNQVNPNDYPVKEYATNLGGGSASPP